MKLDQRTTAGLGAFLTVLIFTGLGYSYGTIVAPVSMNDERPPPKKGETQASHKRVSASPVSSSFQVGQLIVPVIRDGTTVAFILTQIVLETTSPESVDRLRLQLPSLRDGLLQALYGLSAKGYFDTTEINSSEVEETLLTAVRARAKNDEISKLYFDRLLRQESGPSR